MNGPLLIVVFHEILKRVQEKKKKGYPVLVGFTGPAGVGKSTLASVFDYFFAQQGQPVLRISFAWFLKSFLRNNLGITKETDPELYRKLAQQIGTELLRNEVTPRFHVDKLLDYVLTASEKVKLPPVVIIDDVRFPNEVTILDYLFLPVPMDTERRKMVIDNIPTHESECLEWVVSGVKTMKTWYFLHTPNWRDAQDMREFLNMLHVERMSESRDGLDFLIKAIEKGCPKRGGVAYAAAKFTGRKGCN